MTAPEISTTAHRTPDTHHEPTQVCLCGEWSPSATLDEAELMHAAYRASCGHEEWRADYFQCRHSAWHWTPAITTAQCPCARPAYATGSDRNRAARRDNAINGTDTIRARPLTCAHGGHHYSWAPVETSVRHCRCGSVSFDDQDAAEATAAYYRERDPEATVSVYECWRPRFHIHVEGLGAEHHPELPPMEKCQCGKAASTTEEQARALHAKVAAHTGKDQVEVRYYDCHHGSWHWTKRVTFEVCVCGCTVYADAQEAHVAARQAAE